jgi:Na+/H+-dicarboxylate symporter
MIVMPVVFTSLVVGAASISPARLGRVGVKIVAIYMLTSAVAVAIGLLFANLMGPGKGLDLAVANAAGRELQAPSLLTTLIAIIPTNVFDSIVQGAVLQVIFFAVIFGIGISYLKISKDQRLQKTGETLLMLFDGAAEVMYMVVGWILQYAPVGVFALIAVVFGKQGAAAFGPLLSVTATVYIALLVHMLLVYGGIIKGSGLGYLKFLKGARAAGLTAFVTRSSSGTLPVTLKSADEMGVKREVSSFTLPLGATVNMDGTAIYQGVCAIFVANAIGMPLNLTQQLTVIVTAVLASIGTAGVPGAGAIMLLMVLNSIGLPVAEGSPVAMAYAMILGIDALLDMGRTGMNVVGDLACTTVVAKSEKEFDQDIFDGKKAFEA